MEKETYAVQIKDLWVADVYSSLELREKPWGYTDFKRAYAVAEQTGGELYILKPEPMDGEQIQSRISEAMNE